MNKYYNYMTKKIILFLIPLFFLALTITITTTIVKAATSVLPCSDPNGCPDLIVDQDVLNEWFIRKEKFSSEDCAVIEGETSVGLRKLLRVSTGFPNIGPGELFIGDPNNHPELFDFITCHSHAHFKEYADYRLWTRKGYSDWNTLRQENPDALPSELLAANPAIASQMVAGAKRGFCVIDLYQYATTSPAKYTSCDYQGISVGWADAYVYSLDGQWIDITDVKAGTYILEVEVNAEQLFTEANYQNNRASISIKIPGLKK